ncbi:hypothetical protein [Paenibacillus xanthanilyticus]|uniref:Uncharacterized protein n=1 Tax=Paenibacillus xanthanilyticus TaxID=1783531 RepID=A0ABV8KB28_9BACL
MNLNRIETRMMASLYCDQHQTILIDGEPLDALLHRLYPEGFYEGLVPVIVDWMNLPSEQAFVRGKLLSHQQLDIIPILMCPEDCDLSCSVIAAEIERSGETVKWRRMGKPIVNPDEWMTGKEPKMEWLDLVPTMQFDRQAHDAVLIGLLD